MGGQGSAHTARTSLQPSPQAASSARRWMHGLLSGWGVLEQVCEDVVLLLSETVTNSVVHGRTDVGVAVYFHDPCVRVYVSDHARGAPAPRSADTDAEGGRGLALVDALSSEWGVEPDTAGKSVWFEVCPRDAA